MRPTDYPRLYERLTTVHAGEELEEAMRARNPYARDALQRAFRAGWYGWKIHGRVADDFTSGLMTRAGDAAYRRGNHARAIYETDKPGGDAA